MSRSETVPHSRREVAETLERIGVRPSRRFGQSFLTDPYVADAEAALVGPTTGGPVLEIGGGLGILTEALLRRDVGPLTVVEKDRRLAGFLRRAFGDRVRVVEADAREVPLTGVRAIVGNLPFSVGTDLLLAAFDAHVPTVVALVQKEVTDRLTARPGSKSYGRLTIHAALFGTIEAFQVVPPASFTPEPAVSGRILSFTARSEALPVPSVPEFDRLTGLLFSSRRKKLGNLIARVTGSRAEAGPIAERSGWPDSWPDLRPEDLSPDLYFALARSLKARRT